MALLYSFLVTIYAIICLFLILVILVQKGKSSMGLGYLGGTSQLLFGGSGGQDIFQKITWSLGAIFIIGSFLLAIMRTQISKESRYLLPSTSSTVVTPITASSPEQPPVSEPMQ